MTTTQQRREPGRRALPRRRRGQTTEADRPRGEDSPRACRLAGCSHRCRAKFLLIASTAPAARRSSAWSVVLSATSATATAGRRGAVGDGDQAGRLRCDRHPADVHREPPAGLVLEEARLAGAHHRRRRVPAAGVHARSASTPTATATGSRSTAPGCSRPEFLKLGLALWVAFGAVPQADALAA